MPGYRLRLPTKVHPVSAGIKGGIVGGLVMPLPAIAYGYFSGHGIWWPVNLLAGMVLPYVDAMNIAELERFQPTLFVVGVRDPRRRVVHHGADVRRVDADAAEHPQAAGLGRAVDAAVVDCREFRRAGPGESGHPRRNRVALVCVVAVYLRRRRGDRLHALRESQPDPGRLVRRRRRRTPDAGTGDLVEPRRGAWHLVSGQSALGDGTASDGRAVARASWKLSMPTGSSPPLGMHAILSLAFGLAFALVLPRLPAIPGPMAWGGLLLPLLWTAMSYGLMGVVNPVLQERVDWPWFVVSQFVFGIVASIVVVRSEQVYIPPAGKGPDRRGEFVAN